MPAFMGGRTLLCSLLLVASCAYGIGPAASGDPDPPPPTPHPHGTGNDVDAAPAPTPPPDAAGAIVSVAFGGPECIAVRCPSNAPFVVGCADIFLSGNATLGCVATLDPSTVAFQQGDLCRSDSASGRILCSVAPARLDSSNCPLPRPLARYLTSLEGCVY